jgi:hypothetical protein
VAEVFEDRFAEIAALIGRAYQGGGRFGAWSVGVGYVHVRRSGGLFSEERDSSSGAIGVSVGAQLYRQPIRYGGIGLDGFANVNPEASAVGLALSLQIGDVR